MRHDRKMGSQGSFATFTRHRGAPGVAALLDDVRAVMVVLVVESLPISILQFLHAMSASLLVVLFPVLGHRLVSLDLSVIIAVHSRVDLLLRVEIAARLFADARLHDVIVWDVPTRSGGIATIGVQHQVFVQLEVVDMNLLLKQLVLLLNNLLRRHDLAIPKFYVSRTLRRFDFDRYLLLWLELIVSIVFDCVAGIDV